MKLRRLAATVWWMLLVSALPAAAAGDFRLLVMDNAFVKWGEPVLGTGASVTYAFATRETINEDARNCKHIMPYTDLASPAKLPLGALKSEAREAFRTWERVSGLRFREAADESAANIVIGIQANPEGLAFTNVEPARPAVAARLAATLKAWLALRQDDGARVDSIQQSLICLNPRQVWKIGFDGNNKTYDVRYALTHEIGHAIGLDHPGASGALMGFRYTEKVRGLQPGDIAAVRALYGVLPPN